ncbi:MAG: phosphodiester glycosidase family protein [Tepidisphaeraceae bacterium]
MITTLWTCFGIALALLLVAVLTWRRQHWAMRVLGAILCLISLPIGGLGGYLAFRWVAGQPTAISKTLARGVVYRRDVLQQPDLAVLHIVEIDQPHRAVWSVSAPIDTADGRRCRAELATPVSQHFASTVLINANFFTPFYDNWVFDSYPHVGDSVEAIGPVVNEGVRYGRPKADWPSAWQEADGTIGFGELPPQARQAISGRQWLLRAGAVALRQDDLPYPRTAIAMNADHSKLWLVVVDGKQPGYSNGLTLGDLAGYLAKLGASEAIELDGGGSSILVAAGEYGPTVLSRPCHTKIPGRQRPTGVFLGISVRDEPK